MEICSVKPDTLLRVISLPSITTFLCEPLAAHPSGMLPLAFHIIHPGPRYWFPLGKQGEVFNNVGDLLSSIFISSPPDPVPAALVSLN